MPYTPQLTPVHQMISLKLSLMLVQIQKLKMIMEKLQLIMHVKKGIHQQLH
jgi:hypothetical protein